MPPSWAPATPYFHGRLLMIAANSERHGLFNGDLGVVWHDAHGANRSVWFDTVSRPARVAARRNCPRTRPPTSTTVHKAQGSEFERVLLLILPDTDARVLSRELLYTATHPGPPCGAVMWAAPGRARTHPGERRSWRDSGLEARLRQAPRAVARIAPTRDP